MFTGLIEEVGVVERLEKRGAYVVAVVSSSFDDVSPKDSVNVDGACLTVVDVGGGRLTFEVSPETQRLTTIGRLKVGSRVNLERALRLGDRLGGHIVLGHVDGLGKVKGRGKEGGFLTLEFEIPSEIGAYMIPKGSVAVNGVSLTVNEVFKNAFKAGIITYTLENTNLGELEVGDLVNVEADVIGKYVARLMGRSEAGGEVTKDLLERSGFVRDKR